MVRKEISNKDLNKARSSKKDEFYTQRPEIEKEIRFYINHFKNKVVYCNCDDPRVSEFFKFFVLNFKFLGLKKLISTCYKNQDADLFTKNSAVRAVYIEYTGNKKNKTIPDPKKIPPKTLKGDGDFRSEESINFLMQSDIIVTNPPFSLFRQYISQLFEYNKKFLIIGNINAVSFKEVSKLIKENKVWLGPSIHSGDREFGIPDNYPQRAATNRTDPKTGKKYIRIKGVRWYTNLDHSERHKDIVLYKRYYGNENMYPSFDYYKAINIKYVKEIPEDYEGAMAVPITFMDKYNPDQFKIISANDIRRNKNVPFKEHGLIKDKEAAINGKATYVRFVIKNKKKL